MINMTTFNSWINNQDYNFDVAVVRVDRPVGALSGWLGFSWNTTSSFYTSNTFHNPGYPGSPAYNGETMRYWFGFYDSVIGETPRHNNQGYGGQSGSNSWVNQNNSPTVYALLSHGTAPPEPVWTGHVRIDQNKFNTILNYINNHTPSQPDLIPLLAEASPTTVQAGSALSSFSFIIHNYSSIAFSGAIQFKVYLSTNNIISASDTEIWSGSVSNASISAKGSNTVNISTNLPVIPSGTSAGNYYLGVLITSSDANNNNNATAGWDTKPITVSGGGSPNATCSAAATITCGQTVTGTTSGAAQNVSNCGGFDLNTAPGLWYRYTATQTGQVTATTCNSGTTFDTKIGVFSGSCSNLVCVGGNDDDTACSSNLRSTVQFSASSGQTYYIYVTGFQTNSGTFQLSLTCTAAPTLTVSPATISQTAAAGSANISVTSTCSSWTVSGAPAWATVSPTSGSNNGTITVSFQANTSTQSRSATLTISGCSITRTVTITQAGAAVTLEVSPATISQTAAAGSANISVTSTCSSWTVSGAPAWATVSPTSGSNNGNINVSFQANTSTQSRSATLTIAGCSITRTVTITQAGAAVTLEVSPATISQTAAAGSANISVTSTCSSWTVSGAPAWATVSPTSGSNNGNINVSFQANTSTQSRSATLTIAGCSITRTVTITQAGAAVTLEVSPATISQTAAAGSANISVTSTCSSWTVSGAPAWATVSPTSGSNNGTITVSFQANTSTQSRSATLTISGCSITRTVTITQAGTATSLEVSPATISQTAAVGSANISVTSNCSSWTVSGAPAWATVSPTSGSNNGTITVSFQANTSTQSRSATLTISGCSITRTVTITQAGTATSLEVSPATISQTAAVGSANISVTSNCSSWTVSGAPAWATVSPTSGSNNGTITVSFQANTSTQSRSATLTISGCSITRTVTITQTGTATSLEVSPATISQTAAAGSANISVTSNCSSWTVSGAPAWATVSPTSGSNNGTITVSFQANTSTQSRSATLTISGCSITRTVTITQTGTATSLEVSPATISQTAAAGSANISVTSNCSSWTVSGAPAWATVSPTSGSNNGTITVSFQANTSAQSRSATLTISGCSITRTVTITQEAVASTIPWVRSITGSNHIIIVQSSLTATLDGTPLEPGDAIGFFFEHNGALHCSSYLVLSGQNQSVAVYGNDPTAPGKNGFESGEIFRVKVYKAATQQVHDAQVNFAPAGTVIPPLTITHTNTFAANGISLLTNLNASTNSSFRIVLNTGWNMISSHTLPADANMPVVFSDLTSVVEVVKDVNGDAYFPVLNINGLGNWDMTKGYQVRSAADTVLTITGSRVDPAATPIPINSGWQIISYLRTQAAPISEQLASITGIVELVKDNLGVNTYIPGLMINSIGDMRPGQGYQLKASAPGTLTYPANQLWSDPSVVLQSASPVLERAVPAHFEYDRILKSCHNSTLIIRSEVASAMMEPGDEIGVFSTDGILCGAAVFEDRHFAVTIWGDDPTTLGIPEGLLPGEVYQLRIWKSAQNSETNITPVFTSGDEVYHNDDIEIAAHFSTATAVKEPSVEVQPLTVFPNPTGGRFYVMLPAGIEMLELRDAKGALLQRVSQPAGGLLPMETAGYPKGLLLLSAWDAMGRRWYAKVVVQ